MIATLGDFKEIDRMLTSVVPTPRPSEHYSFKVPRKFMEGWAMHDGAIGRLARRMMQEDAEKRERAMMAGPACFIGELPNGVQPWLREVMPGIYEPGGDQP